MFYSDFADDYEEIFPFRENTYKFISKMIDSGKKDILDIGCGTGHYCGRFAGDGFDACGIDLDREMINTARKKYPEASFSVLNLTDIGALNRKFDLIFSTGNVMAHVNENELQSFLLSLKVMLNDNSLWIFQVINWDYILELKEFSFPVIETEKRSFIRHYKDIQKNKLIFQTELRDKTNNKSLFQDRVTMYPIRSEKYIKLHESMGFKLMGHYSDFAETPYKSNEFSADIYVFTT